MKKSKIIRYSWEELSGTEELDDPHLEAVRCAIRQSFVDRGLSAFQFLMCREAAYIALNPGSDFCVVLCRLFEQLSRVQRMCTPWEVSLFRGDTVSGANFEGFCIYVKSAFTIRPMPVVLGQVPRIY